MRRQHERRIAAGLVFVALMTSAATLAPTRAHAQDMSSSDMGLPAGAKITVMQGKPASEASTMRMTLPAGYIVALHRHPNDEMVTVISGTYIVTYGAVATTLSTGQSTTIKANSLHTERTQEPTVIEVRWAGPYAIVYAPKDSTPNAAKP
jgi:quercetin dioxygenase-like cupin family protein